MRKQSSTEQRVDALMALSDRIYPLIEAREEDGELRARRILRLGMQVVADTLQTKFGILTAGHAVHRLLIDELAKNGLSIDEEVYDQFPRYKSIVNSLPPNAPPQPVDEAIDSLTIRYADVKRATSYTTIREKETNDVHVIHLAAIALPYAAEYYPELDQRKLALYFWIHDVLEAYTGDIPTFGMSDEDNDRKKLDEHKALSKLEEDFGEHYPKLVSAIYDYENLADDEAKFVKTFDKLDPGFTHFATQGRQLISFYGIQTRQEHLDKAIPTTKRIEKYGSHFPLVLKDRHELIDRIGKITWTE